MPDALDPADLLRVFARSTRWPDDVAVGGWPSGLALPAVADLTAQLELGLFRWPYVQVKVDDAHVHPSRFTRSRTIMDTRIQGFVDPPSLFELMDAGGVVIVHSLEHWHAPFDSWLRAIVDPVHARTHVAFGRPLRLAVEPDPGLLGVAIVPLSDSGPLWIERVTDEGARTGGIAAGQVLLMSGAGASGHRIVSDGDSVGGVAVVARRRPTLDDVLAALVRRARVTADESLTARYHQWDGTERRRRTARALARTIDELENSAERAGP